MSLTVLIAILIVAVAVIIAAVLLLRGQKGRFSLDIGGAKPTASGGEDTSSETGFKGRINVMTGIVGGVIAVILGKLWSMQVVSSADYTALAESNRTRTISTRAARGKILDRNGVEIVKNRASLTVVAYESLVSDDFETRLLANVLGMPKMAVKRKAQDETEGAQSSHTISVDVTRRAVAFLDEHASIFPYVDIEERTQRTYPFGNLAAQLLGYTGTITTEQLNSSSSSDSGTSISYQSGDIVGQAGIEYQYESVLQGIRGEQKVYVDANGKVTSYSTSVEPEAGSDVMLTIDAHIQKAAEEGLAKAIAAAVKGGIPQCKAGGVVAIDATNGEVLAIASQPTYNPSIFVGGISNDDWTNLSSETSSYPLLDRAIAGLYPSASTIKPLTTFAALDYGIANENSTFYCTGWWTGFGEAYGKYCWEHNGHGTMTLVTGITYSCDTVFYEVAKGFWYSDNKEGLQATFRKWGLGTKTGIDLPGEQAGRVPDAQWKWNYFTSATEDARTWQGGDTANIAIGQGDLLVTPLQMAVTYMGIANKGTQWVPHLLKQVMRRDGSGSVVSYEPRVLRTVEEPALNYELVDKGMYGVIYEENEDITKRFRTMSETVLGKTGTGETGSSKEPYSWFCAFAPAESPKYVLTSCVEEGGFGADAAIFAIRDMFAEIFNEPDTSQTTTTS